MSAYSHDFLKRQCIFNYNGYYSSLTYEHLVLDSELSTCLKFNNEAAEMNITVKFRIQVLLMML